MNMMAEKIRDTITIPMVLSQYGYQTSSRRRIPCPIHQGKDPNFCYTDKVYHCWSCGAKGDVISLVMTLFGLSFQPAMMKLNHDFCLGLSTAKPTLRERRQMAENRALCKAYKRWKQKKKCAYDGLCALHREVFRRIALGEADDEIIALQGDLESWLDDNIEEVVRPWR